MVNAPPGAMDISKTVEQSKRRHHDLTLDDAFNTPIRKQMTVTALSLTKNAHHPNSKDFHPGLIYLVWASLN